MAITDRQILPLTDPTLKVDPMTLEDNESEDKESSKYSTQSSDKGTSDAGSSMPRVQINTAVLTAGELSFFSLKQSGFKPSLKLVVEDVDTRFGDIDFPKDGDVVSVFLRPEDVNNLAEIRIDFDILSIKFTPGDGTPNTFVIEGTMKIPGLYAEDCEALAADSSFNHLNTIADNLGLGYASNDDTTDDVMTRIRPYDTNLKFIKDITLQSYKNDDSFWTSYIDPHYYLCFINVNKQFGDEDVFEDGILTMSTNPNKGSDTKGEDEGKGYLLVLTNEEQQSSTNMFIEKYGLINNAGNTWIANGYKRYCQYYDIPTKEWSEVFVDPLTTEGAEEESILLKGRADEDIYKSQVKYKYLGKQLGGASLEEGYNMHENFMFSQILNYQNLEEINKMVLSVELSMANFNIYRFQRIPIILYTNNESVKRLNEGRNKELGEEPGDDEPSGIDDATTQSKNEFLSGYYVVNDIEYIYRGNGSPITQKLTCLRREWAIPLENKDY